MQKYTVFYCPKWNSFAEVLGMMLVFNLILCMKQNATKTRVVRTHLACLHDQNKSGFLEGWLFSNQSEIFENF